MVNSTPTSRAAAFDVLRLAIGTALAADRTLGGPCDFVPPMALEPVLLAIIGNVFPDDPGSDEHAGQASGWGD